jgi:signal transduction histidine kinase
MKEKYKKNIRNIESYKIIITHIIIGVILFYIVSLLIPIVFNYPKNALVEDFQVQIDKIVYSHQIVILMVVIVAITTASLYLHLKAIIKFEKKLRLGEKIDYEMVDEIRKKCIRTPNRFYLFLVIVPLFVLLVLFLITGANIIAMVKIYILAFSFLVLCATVLNVFSQKYYKNIILKTYYIKEEYTKLNMKPQKLGKKIFYQTIPIFFLSILLVGLFAYANNSKEKGNTKFFYYKSQIVNNNFSNITQLENYLNNINFYDNQDIGFIYDLSKQEYIYNTQKIKFSKFFTLYMNTFIKENEGRVYDYYGVEAEGYIKEININGNKYYIGVHYITTTTNVIVYYFQIIIILFLVITIIAWLLTREISKNISYVLDKLKDVSNQEINNTKKRNEVLPVLSKDEFGELAISYNKIQKNNNEFINEIQDTLTQLHKTQDQLIEKNKLSLLGELAGGMAHDINTPIATINNCIYAIQNSAVDEEQKKMCEVARASSKQIINIVNSLRNQIRNIGDNNKIKFSLKEVLKDVLLITSNELNSSKCKLNINIEDDIYVYGEANKLSQVIINLVVNSIQAYQSNNISGVINIVVKQNSKKIYIDVEDFALGIKEKVRDGIFKEILTTKGTKGTGIGVYLVYSIIKSSFNGEITFETKTNEGTKFKIVLPKEDVKNGEN